MPSEIKDKYSSAAAITITVASLATSSAGVGRQGDIVDNSTDRFQRLKVYGKFKLGASPVAGSINLFAIRGDKHGTAFRSDGAGASDAALTFLNSQPIGVGRTKSSPSTGDLVYIEGEILAPGPEWTVGLFHDTGVNLDSTAGSHFIHWIGLDPEVQ